MSNQINPAKKSLTIKDLVTTGIFSAIFLVFTMIGGIFFAPNPVLTFYMPMGAALLCGPVYLLMIAKVQKRWSVTILGIIMGIIWFVTGMHWAFSLGYIGMGIIADLVAGAGDYRNKAVNLLSYHILRTDRTAVLALQVPLCHQRHRLRHLPIIKQTGGKPLPPVVAHLFQELHHFREVF